MSIDRQTVDTTQSQLLFPSQFYQNIGGNCEIIKWKQCCTALESLTSNPGFSCVCLLRAWLMAVRSHPAAVVLVLAEHREKCWIWWLWSSGSKTVFKETWVWQEEVKGSNRGKGCFLPLAGKGMRNGRSRCVCKRWMTWGRHNPEQFLRCKKPDNIDFFFFFETGSYYVPPAGLKFPKWTKLVSPSQVLELKLWATTYG